MSKVFDLRNHHLVDSMLTTVKKAFKKTIVKINLPIQRDYIKPRFLNYLHEDFIIMLIMFKV